MIVSSRGTACLWDKILQVILDVGEYEILSSVDLGRNEYKLWMLFCSANLGKSRVTYGSEDSGGLSLRDASFGKPRACAKGLSPQAMLIPDAKAAVDKEWETLEKVLEWQLTKVRNKKEVIDEARKECKTVHFASFMDICHLKISELEPTFQKYKAKLYFEVTLKKMIQALVVLRWTILDRVQN